MAVAQEIAASPQTGRIVAELSTLSLADKFQFKTALDRAGQLPHLGDVAVPDPAAPGVVAEGDVHDEVDVVGDLPQGVVDRHDLALGYPGGEAVDGGGGGV